MVGPSTGRGLSINLDSQNSMNCWEASADSPDAKSPSALLPVPGFHFLSDSDGTNKALLSLQRVRGLNPLPLPNFPQTNSYGFLAVTSTWIYVVLGVKNVLTGNMAYVYNLQKAIISNMALARFGSSPLKTVIVHGGSASTGYASVMTITSWAVADPIVFSATPGDYVPLADVVYLAGYWLGFCINATASAPNGRQQIFYSGFTAGVSDPELWSAADFFGATATPGSMKRLIVKNDHLWVFKDDTIPVFSPTGDSNNPFAPLETATINVGCLDGATVAQEGQGEGDHIYWVSPNLVVYQTLGATAERISGAYQEKVLRDTLTNFGINGLDGISSFCNVEQGHPLYHLSIPNAGITLVWDALTKKWHDRGWWNADTGEYECDIPYVHVFAGGKHIVGDSRLNLDTGVGALYETSETFDDLQIQPLENSPSHAAGTDTFMRWERTGPHIAGKNYERLTIGTIELEFETGIAVDANGATADPQVMLEISRDAGHNFGNSRARSIGAIGKTTQRCRFERNGSGFDVVLRISGTMPQKLIAAYADIEVGG